VLEITFSPLDLVDHDVGRHMLRLCSFNVRSLPLTRA
jgi:hypothetical protein